jgi:hypothetical protein
MADRPEDAVALSDADLDELVGAAERDDDSIATDTGTEPQGSADISDEAQTRDDTPGETEVGAESEQVDDPAREASPEGDLEDDAQPPAEVDEKPPGSRPFTVKGAGQQHAIPGVTEMPDGSLRASKEGASTIRQNLASALGIQAQWKQERRELQTQLRDATEKATDREVEAEQIVNLFADLRTMTPEERWAWANEFDEKAPKLEIEIEKRKLDRDRKALERQRSGAPATEEEALEQRQEILTTEMRTTFQRIMALPEAANLTQEDKLALWNKWSRKPDKLVVVADRDMPELGIKKGEPYFDDADVVEDFNDRVALRQSIKGTLTAAQRNQAMNADRHRSSNPIPPVVRGRQPAGNGSRQPTKLKGKAFSKAFLEGKLDDPD